MEISTRGRYAVRVMVDIACQNEEYVSITNIAKRQEISIKYLEKIISMLLKANLLTSLRGTNGGYKLTKKAKDYNIKEILDATGDQAKLATCIDSNCPRAKNCSTIGVWNTLTDLINDYLQKVSLQDLIDKTYKK